jgi:hypothetical protein
MLILIKTLLKRLNLFILYYIRVNILFTKVFISRKVTILILITKILNKGF